MTSPADKSWRTAGAGVRVRARGAMFRLASRASRPLLAQPNARLAALRRDLDAIALRLPEDRRSTEQRLDRLDAVTEDLIMAAEALRRRIEDDASDTYRELTVTPYIAGDPYEQFDTPVGRATGYRAPPPGTGTGTAYVGFEALMRGPEERVSELQSIYVPLLKGHGPVLDLGCGRGELLALLGAAGVPATGVDADPGMVARCREQGLTVEQADVLEHLESLAPASLGAIFCAQVIEHLSGEQIFRLLAAMRDKLAPGALAIIETVNPHSLTAFKMFWIDPTHQHPIFPESMLALCAGAGFDEAFVFAPGFADYEAARLQAHTYAAVASVERGPHA